MFRAQTLAAILAIVACSLLVPNATAQLISFSKQDLIDYTKDNPFDRLSDGRPRCRIT